MTFTSKNLAKLVPFGKTQIEFKAVLPSEARILFHWKIFIAGFFVMAVSALFTSVWIYREVERGEFFSAADSSVLQSSYVTKEVFDAVVNNFEIKKAAFEQVRRNRAVSIDPSK